MWEILKREGLRLWNRVGWSFEGFLAAWTTEKSLRQWTMVNLASAALALALDLTAGERALILALGLVVLAAELFNTAIEGLVDYISPQRDPRAKKIKDCSSAAVAIAALAGGVAWIVVLLG
jgi:diacylglycerol kinase (ATP)